MNILHTETLKRWGGEQNRVLMEAKGLRERGHKVIIACNRGSVLAQKAKAAGIKVYELNMNKKTYFKTIPQLIKIIKKENIDIVSTHSSVDSWAGGIAAKLTGRKLVRFRHNIYPIGRDPLTKFIYTIPDTFIVTSYVTRDILRKRIGNRKTIVVIPSSIDLKIFDLNVDDLRNELRISPNTTVIGNTSTFTRVKGLEFLFQAFNFIHGKIPSILMVAGRLPESRKSKYLNHIKEGLRDKVFLLGYRDDIPRVLKTSDIFVFPSILDSTPQSLLEAMAMERPVVVSDIPTFRYFIKDMENGIYFKPGDPKDLAEKVISLIQKEDLRRKIGKNARSTILKNFTMDKMIIDTEMVYKEIFCN